MFTTAAFLLLTVAAASAAKAPATCDTHFEKVGCFKRYAGNLHKLLINDRDITSSAHTGHILNWKKINESIHSLACRCEEKAKSEGYTFFGIAFWAECWGGNDEAAITKLLIDNEAIDDCKTYGFKDCVDSSDLECIGRKHSEYVYKVGSGDVGGEIKINGGFSEWGPYGECSKKCGGGTQERSRSCSSPAPQYGGNDCEGASVETRVCNEAECPVDGVLSEWGPYEECSKSCGGGMQSRSRTCTPPKFGGKPCEGITVYGRVCNNQACPVDGRLSAWGPYGDCSKSCGGGTQSRSRACTPPKFGGKPCEGSTEESRVCNDQGCPVDGRFSDWGPYGRCSKQCNHGFKSRSRTCTPPKFGGRPCAGPATETMTCNNGACQVIELTAGVQRSQASQSHRYNHIAHAYNAIDGNTNTHYIDGRSCTHTWPADKPAWWRLDLLKAAVVTKVKIWNRSDCCSERLSNFVVSVGNNPKGTGNAVCGRGLDTRNVLTMDLTCPHFLIGRYLHISIPEGPLTVCEVKVWGYFEGCTEVPCSREYQPVCGSNGKTYPNRCSFENAKCANSDLFIVSDNECKKPCFFEHKDYHGSNLNAGCVKQDSEAACQSLCKETKGCHKFSYVTSSYNGPYAPGARNNCCLKPAKFIPLTDQEGVTSGPKYCSE